MPVLIHLNGPPAIGKSTLAARYAAEHPGTLNLDIDVLHPLVGGWQDGEQDVHQILRPVALAMAATHLQGGRDVILPQCLTGFHEVDAFEQVAHEQGAVFREVVLLADRPEAVDRFDQRADDSVWGAHNRRTVARLGGRAMLAAIYDQLLEVLGSRPSAVIVRSEPGDIDGTYASLERALGAGSEPN